MIKHILSVFSILCLFINGFTQQMSNPKFDTDSIYQSILDEQQLFLGNHSDEAIVNLKKQFGFKFYFNQEDDLMEERVFYSKKFINDLEAVTAANKAYVNIGAEGKLIDFKIRVINLNNEIINLTQADIIESTDEDGNVYNYCAIPKLTAGSIIEKIEHTLYKAKLSGASIDLQQNLSTKEYQLDFEYPVQLPMEFHLLNQDRYEAREEKVQEDYVIISETDSSHTFKFTNLNRIEEEEISNIENERLGLFFQLKSNLFKNVNKVYSYGAISQRIYEQNTIDLSDKDNKSILKYFKSIRIPKNIKNDVEKTARFIENELKSKFEITREYSNEYFDYQYAINENIIHRFPFVSLSKACYEYFGIECEIVLTSNRFSRPFSEDIESYYFLQDYLFYFPQLDLYTAAHNKLYRIGLIPPIYQTNNALYISPYEIGDITTGFGEVIQLPEIPSKDNVQNMDVKVSFNENRSAINIDAEVTFSGEKAIGTQTTFSYIPQDKQLELKESLLDFSFPDLDYKTLEVKNEGNENLMLKPFQLLAEIETDNYHVTMEDEILLKLGEFIGPQSEMYQEKERTFYVDNYYNREYNRIIQVEIPEGYQVVNLEELVIQNEPFGENVKAGFVSKYEMNDQQLIVDVREYYDNILFQPSEFEMFRSVINEASDFTKIVLVLKKM